jgi:hypothetical protein
MVLVFSPRCSDTNFRASSTSWVFVKMASKLIFLPFSAEIWLSPLALPAVVASAT